MKTSCLKAEYYYVKKQTNHQDKHKELNKKSTQDGDAIIEYFEKKMTELEFQEDTDLLNNWSQEIQLYCILKIYLTYGVMRPSEIVDCLICNCDGDDTTNYINVNTKQIVINNHKNDRKGKKVIDISSDKKLLGILRKVIGQFLVTNQQGELYQSSSAFTKMFKSHFNDYTPYDLRKAISSKYIAEGDVEKIKKLEHNQSHSLQVILDNYNVYTKSS